MANKGTCYIGVDVGTGGVRACALDATGRAIAEVRRELPTPQGEGDRREQDPEDWWLGLQGAVAELASHCTDRDVAGLAVDGTSGTVLLADGEGVPLGPALLYHDGRARDEAREIAEAGPRESGAHGTGGSLAKALHLFRQVGSGKAAYVLHPADWLSGRLIGGYGISDENNALKLGYDPVARRWPEWVGDLLPPNLLPRVAPPGDRVGILAPGPARDMGLIAGTPVRAGTTDSVAAFLATGAAREGEAVTVLGSTLALKVLGPEPVFAPEFGVYSHRLGDRWLAGGASNSGGAVLLQELSEAELEALTPELRPEEPTGLDYLPLPGVGERFPDNDPNLRPRLEPRPASRVTLLQGMLEGIAAIEARGYRRLAELGAPYPNNVRTAGGGARNPAWTRIRQRLLGVPVTEAIAIEACYGAARLAGAGDSPD